MGTEEYYIYLTSIGILYEQTHFPYFRHRASHAYNRLHGVLPAHDPEPARKRALPAVAFPFGHPGQRHVRQHNLSVLGLRGHPGTHQGTAALHERHRDHSGPRDHRANLPPGSCADRLRDHSADSTLGRPCHGLVLRPGPYRGSFRHLQQPASTNRLLPHQRQERLYRLGQQAAQFAASQAHPRHAEGTFRQA